LVGGIVFGVIGIIGFWPFALIALVIGIVLWGKHDMEIEAAAAANEKARRAPCQHGVAFAKSQPSHCAQCSAAKRQREEVEARRREDADKKMREAHLAREREYAEKVRQKDYLTRMKPEAFEKLVCELYRRMGYHVRSTKLTADGGSDGFLTKDGKKYVLQCKRVKESVGTPVLRDLFGTMFHFKCDGAVVVTTGTVSQAARAWIRGKPIEIVELAKLQGWLRSYYPSKLPRPASAPIFRNTPLQRFSPQASTGGERFHGTTNKKAHVFMPNGKCQLCGCTRGAVGRFGFECS
jgi:hypothetical protein